MPYFLIQTFLDDDANRIDARCLILYLEFMEKITYMNTNNVFHRHKETVT
jgi:hypothetical protein